MEIVRTGRTGTNATEPRLYECSCGCAFKFAKIEAEYIIDSRDGDYWAIDCPECARACTVSARIWP